MNREKEREHDKEREREGVKLRLYTEIAIRELRIETPNATCCRVETPGATEAKESPFGGCCRYGSLGRGE